jgi:hypothetical protein
MNVVNYSSISFLQVGVEIEAFDSLFAFNNFMLLNGSRLVEVSNVNKKP